MNPTTTALSPHVSAFLERGVPITPNLDLTPHDVQALSRVIDNYGHGESVRHQVSREAVGGIFRARLEVLEGLRTPELLSPHREPEIGNFWGDMFAYNDACDTVRAASGIPNRHIDEYMALQAAMVFLENNNPSSHTVSAAISSFLAAITTAPSPSSNTPLSEADVREMGLAMEGFFTHGDLSSARAILDVLKSRKDFIDRHRGNSTMDRTPWDADIGAGLIAIRGETLGNYTDALPEGLQLEYVRIMDAINRRPSGMSLQ